MKTIVSDSAERRPNPILISIAQRRKIMRAPNKDRVQTILFLGAIADMAQGDFEQSRQQLLAILGGKRRAKAFGKELRAQLVDMAEEVVKTSVPRRSKARKAAP